MVSDQYFHVKKHKKLIYLDSAATTQKPKPVIDAVSNFFSEYNSNVARGFYDLSLEAERMYEQSRKKIAEFINAENSSEIIFLQILLILSETELPDTAKLGRYSLKFR